MKSQTKELDPNKSEKLINNLTTSNFMKKEGKLNRKKANKD